jgi:hypothetical protein
MLAASPPKMISGKNFRTKATLESSISRLSFESEARKKGSPQDGYPGTAFSRQSPRNANHQPARMRRVAGRSGGAANHAARKEQGRRRSIPLTALPAPDIEIGSRRPVECIVARDSAGICDPFHNRRKKVAARPGDALAAARQANRRCCALTTAPRGGRGNLDRLR